MDVRRGRPGLVEVRTPQAPAAEVVDEPPDAVVGVVCERNRLALAQKPEQHARGCGEPRGEEQGVAPVEGAEGRLRRRAGGMAVAGVRVLPGTAVVVGPDRRAVDRRPGIHV
jgi:hypothetical protein